MICDLMRVDIETKKLFCNMFINQSWFDFNKCSDTCILKNISDRSATVDFIAGKHFTSVITAQRKPGVTLD